MKTIKTLMVVALFSLGITQVAQADVICYAQKGGSRIVAGGGNMAIARSEAWNRCTHSTKIPGACKMVRCHYKFF